MKKLLIIEKYKNALLAGSIIGISIACFFLHGVDDLYRYYLPFAQGCLNCGFVPYHSKTDRKECNLA